MMTTILPSKKNLLLFCCGVFSILVIQYLVRPASLNAPLGLRFMMNIYPSLIGAALIPLVFVNFAMRLLLSYQVTMFRWFCILGFISSLSYELLQTLPFLNKTFDYFDVLASMIGITIGYFVTVPVVKQRERNAELVMSMKERFMN